MSQLAWYFSKNEHGTKRGYSDAGMETFRRSPFASIARETIQNSLDAHDGSARPVVVSFSAKKVKASEVPDVAGLSKAMHACLKMWQANKRAKKFFSEAIRLLQEDQIPVLLVADRNTVGLTGGDQEAGTPWDSLIRSIGASSKNEGEGGSFGIGSSAPFAASSLRTVFYSTRTAKTKQAFIGRTRLTTHEDARGARYDENGYLGLGKGERVERQSEIPSFMRRDEVGTTVAVLGFCLGENVGPELLRAVLEHFWPAIHMSRLEVEIDGKRIARNNLGKLLTTFANADSQFNAHEFYRCLSSADESVVKVEKNLRHLGDVELLLRTADYTLPKCVAMVRKTGMVISLRKFISPAEYCGVFLCTNDLGNNKLRDMEPPEHNEWSPNLPEHGASKKIHSELTQFVRDEIKKLISVDDSKPLDIAGLSKYLPETEDDPEGGHGNGSDEIPFEAVIPTSPIGTKPPKKTSDDLGDLGPSPGKDVDESDDDESEEEGGPSGGPGLPPGGRRENEVAIRQRCFSVDRQGAKYTLQIRPVEKGTKVIDLTVRVVGEDGVENLTISEATVAGATLNIVAGNVIKDVSLAKNKPTSVELTLADPKRVALEVVAHED